MCQVTSSYLSLGPAAALLAAACHFLGGSPLPPVVGAKTQTRWGANMSDPTTLDRWIQELMDCKPLTESEVETLCDKVCAMAASGGKASFSLLGTLLSAAHSRLPRDVRLVATSWLAHRFSG